MDQAWKKKWVDALRSGKYQKGTGLLRSSDYKYCCLGVLCDLFDPSKWSSQFSSWSSQFYFDGEMGWLPSKMAYELGISPDIQRALMVKNDDQAESFEEIADFIEQVL